MPASALACLPACALAFLLAIAPALTRAEPLIAPGRLDLRLDIQTLADAGVIDTPTTAWPLSWQSVIGGLEDVVTGELSPAERASYERLRAEAQIAEQTHRLQPHIRIGVIGEPNPVRSFATRPRTDGELEAGISYTGDRLTFNIDLTRTVNSTDDWRLDGSYIGFATRRWAVIAGYPERWWGPGVQGSLILSTNARPVPQIGVERISTEPFDVGWLRWLGPWTVSTFIGELDDERVIRNAKLFGARFTARPLAQVEFGISRAAQLCGAGRPCTETEFANMLLGRDNQGRNVNAENEPGNQLAGFDIRWSLPERPLAFYWQWIGEDSRQGGPQIGSFMRMLGAEIRHDFLSENWTQRTWVEIADTTCQQGGIGFGGNKFNCSYQHGTYQTGYRYEGLPLGYTTDTDSESLAVISAWNGPANQSWDFSAYSVRVNQGPIASQPHSLSPNPASRYGIEIGHSRDLPVGRIRMRLIHFEQRDQITNLTTSDTTAAIEYLVGYW